MSGSIRPTVGRPHRAFAWPSRLDLTAVVIRPHHSSALDLPVASHCTSSAAYSHAQTLLAAPRLLLSPCPPAVQCASLHLNMPYFTVLPDSSICCPLCQGCPWSWSFVGRAPSCSALSLLAHQRAGDSTQEAHSHPGLGTALNLTLGNLPHGICGADLV